MTDMAASDDCLLSIEGLSFSFGESGSETVKPTVSDLSLNISQGEILCILGASGCGKTTLLNLIAGLLKPNKGAIDIRHASASGQQLQKIGYIFQNDALFPWRTVESNLMLAAEMNKTAKAAAKGRISEYLKTFHLSETILKKYPAQLSGGMRQRTSIIQTLMFDPNLLLLDEPFSALDYYTKLSLESEFYQLVKEQRKAALLVTHDIEEAVAMGDRVFIMSEGKLLKEFPIAIGDNRLPENARGMPEFAEHYRVIWSELKSVIKG